MAQKPNPTTARPSGDGLPSFTSQSRRGAAQPSVPSMSIASHHEMMKTPGQREDQDLISHGEDLVGSSIEEIPLMSTDDRLSAVGQDIEDGLPRATHAEVGTFVTMKDVLYAPSMLAKPSNATLLKSSLPFIEAITSSKGEGIARLACPTPDIERYGYLRTGLNPEKTQQTPARPRYFFALNLHDNLLVLPTLIGSIVKATRILGAENCAVSIVEGRSVDGTYEVLSSLEESLDKMGVKYFLVASDVNPETDDRIRTLASLRNLALRPLFENGEAFDKDTVIVYINDVAICTQDLLELVHQRRFLQADMTCAMDWTLDYGYPTFYDVWIARGMTGDTFWQIQDNGAWSLHWDLFWNDKHASKGLITGQPFQVFACWNGAVVFTAKPILEHKISFRQPREGECFQGEPTLFCKDLWKEGHGKIAVIPSVNLGYSDEDSKRIKSRRGYVSDVIRSAKEEESTKIGWRLQPPEQVKCMPSFERQTWVHWDE